MATDGLIYAAKNNGNTADMHVLIVGAGLGGLTAAAILLQRGHTVRVYEQAAALGEVGAGIQISANACKVLQELGLGDALDALAVAPTAFRFQVFNSGELLHEIPLGDSHEQAFGAKYYHIHRADLHSMLARRVTELDRDAIVLKRSARSFAEDHESILLRFADGSETRGDLLIGADGIKSAVRAQIIGDIAAYFTGYVAWRAVVDADQLPANYMDKVCTVWVGPQAHAVVYYLRRGELLNFVGIVENDDWRDESWTVKDSWDKLKADFVPWHEDVQLLIDSLPRLDCYRWALYNRPPVTAWSTARATLLGDAAHPTLPFMAQGAAMAIEDSAILVRALAQADTVDAALQLYQHNRYARTARIQNGSNQMGELYHLNTVAKLREGFDRHDISSDQHHWLYSYDPLTVPLIPPGE